MENVLSSAYDEFPDHLASLVENKFPVPGRLRCLHHMETELDTYMNTAGSRADSQACIYLMRASGLVKTEIGLLHFALRYPECRNTPADTGKGQTAPFSLRWKGSLVNLTELIVSLCHLGAITDGNGNRQSFVPLMMALEEFLYTRIPEPYDLRMGLARRRKSLSILFLKLRETFEKNIIDCGVGDG